MFGCLTIGVMMEWQTNKKLSTAITMIVLRIRYEKEIEKRDLKKKGKKETDKKRGPEPKSEKEQVEALTRQMRVASSRTSAEH